MGIGLAPTIRAIYGDSYIDTNFGGKKTGNNACRLPSYELQTRMQKNYSVNVTLVGIVSHIGSNIALTEERFLDVLL